MYHGERFNSITHLVGLVLAVVGTAVLVVVAAMQRDPWKITSFAIYGAMMILLYVSSLLYHSFRGGPKKVFRVFDHCAIYLLIAGTYTPFTLVTLRGPWGWGLFATVWSLAIAGIVKDIAYHGRYRVISVVLYVLMGWSIVVAFGPLMRAMPLAGVAWLIAGGLAYTVGIVFYGLSKKFTYGHGVWHLFVLAGTILHFVAVIGYIAPAAAPALT
jgi:hemolysin III